MDRGGRPAVQETQGKRRSEPQIEAWEGKKKSSRAEGLFKQVHKTITLLTQNPRHPGLQTHEYRSLEHPYNPEEKVFEAYAQHKTSGAYRVFWCYGPEKAQLTIIAITAHP